MRKIDTHNAYIITFACKTEIVGRKLVFVVPYSIYDDGLSNIGISWKYEHIIMPHKIINDLLGFLYSFFFNGTTLQNMLPTTHKASVHLIYRYKYVKKLPLILLWLSIQFLFQI